MSNVNGSRVKQFFNDSGWIRIWIVIGATGVMVWHRSGVNTDAIVDLKASQAKAATDVANVVEKQAAEVRSLVGDVVKNGCEPGKAALRKAEIQEVRTEFFIRQLADTDKDVEKIDGKLDKLLDEVKELAGK